MVNFNLGKISVFIIIILFIYSKELYLRKINKNSVITLTVKGTGRQQILNENFSPLPSEILINNETQSQNSYVDNLTLNETIITMKWNFSLTNCSKMFFGESNITKIDEYCNERFKWESLRGKLVYSHLEGGE